MRRIVAPAFFILLWGFTLVPVPGPVPAAAPIGEAYPAAVEAGGAWLDPAWGYRMSITVPPDSIEGSAAFLQFPVLVALDAAQTGLFLLARSDGADLRVTKRDGVTVLPVEVVHYDPDARRGELWFQADSLSRSVNEFYLYFGKPSALPLPGSPFSSPYLAVYHFQDDPVSHVLTDSGPHANDAAAGLGSTFSSADALEGPVGQAWRFNGQTSWIDADALASSDSSFTIEGWFGCWNQLKPSDADFAFHCSTGWHLSAKRNTTSLHPDYVINGAQFIWDPTLPDTLPHSYVWAMDGVNDTIRFYYDGVERNWINRYVNPNNHGPKVYTGLPISGNISIGSSNFGSSQDQLQGALDEFRLRTGALGPEWIKTEYRNEKTPAGFLLFGPVETPAQTGVAQGPATPPRILLAQNRPNPWRGATRIGFTLETPGMVRLGVFAPDGREVVRLADGFYDAGQHSVGWGGRDGRGVRVAAGVYLYRLEVPGASRSRALILLP